MPALQELIETFRVRVNQALHVRLPSGNTPAKRLYEAMRYAVFGGGKRVRPVLVYATGDALGVELHQLDGPACAVELVHAYSLVHDDLPAMDDDDLRRGKPTCHKQFDEATAILAGDALQALAYSVLAKDRDMVPDHSIRLRMLAILTDASGSEGMAGGQAIDLDAVGKQLDLPALENMHRLKTGALIRASVQLGALSCRSITEELLDRLMEYANAVGLAFQIVDDILDVTGNTKTLGKTQGADRARNKPTYPALLSLDGARRHAAWMHEKAMESLRGLGDDFDTLRELSAYIIRRSY